MNKQRKISLSCWNTEFKYDLRLDGEGTLILKGATKDGAGQEHIIELSIGEWGLRGLAKDIRDKFRSLKRYRLNASRKSLEIFDPEVPS